MKSISEVLVVSIPLNAEAYHLAEKFSLDHDNPDKAKQVFQNTLAVSAVNFYLSCMEIETNWETSYSWNPLMQTLLDTADLDIIGMGKIECHPVLIADEVVQIPLEVCLDRIGYVIVQIEETRKIATLLGFSKTVPENGELFINNLQPISDLLSLLSQPSQPIHLSQWLKNIVEAGWETIESLLTQQHTDLAFRYRTAEGNSINKQDNQTLSLERSKLFDLRQNYKSEPVALLVELIPTSENVIDIWVKVCAFGEEKYLPEELLLEILNEEGIIVMQALAKSTENIQLLFSSEIGEKFSVKLTLKNVDFTEEFLV